jgi:glucokinase
MAPESKKPALPVLAIDLGGTKIASAIVSDTGKILARDYRLTLADEGVEPVMGRIFQAVEQLLKESKATPSQLDSISIASAGTIDSERGLVSVSPNLPGWYDIPLRDRIKERFGISTLLLNDASAAALGEHRLGAGRGTVNLIYITVSTGIGGGIIIDGGLYLGSSGSAGEIGHMTIDTNGPECYCGNKGCLEVLASGTAIAREAKKSIAAGESSALTDMVAGKTEAITAREVSLAAEGGDPLALKVVAETANYLGVGMTNVVNIFNPDMVVIGGSVAKMGDRLLEPVRQVVAETAFGLSAQAVQIVPAGLGDDVGLLGAALYALEQKDAGNVDAG